MHQKISEKDQAAMAGMDALIKAEEQAEDAKCQAVLKELKSSVNAEIYADIICELGESHTFSYDITTSPAGSEQDDGASWGKHFVNQTRNGGMTGDDFGGTMYIPIGDGRYFQFGYSM